MENKFNIKTTGVIFSVVLLLFCSTGYAGNVDPDNDGSRYAWAENAGWLNLEPSFEVLNDAEETMNLIEEGSEESSNAGI